MPSKMLEQLNSDFQERTHHYHTARLEYEDWINAHPACTTETCPPELHTTGQNSTSLNEAIDHCQEAIRICIEERASWRDVATAWELIGMIRFIQGKWGEAVEAFNETISIISDLPFQRETRRKQLSNCRYYLGMIALGRQDLQTARNELTTSLALDESIYDSQSAALCRKALVRLESAESGG